MIKCLKKHIDGITSIEDRGDTLGFNHVYDIRLLQNLDHKDPSAGQFEQRIYLYHKDRKKPMVMATEGYRIRDRKYELTEMLDANQISIEFRYFEESRPDEMDWQYLTNEQAVNDYHVIREKFGKIYKKEWASTGISKGGTNTMIYKAFFPEDVVATVNHVGPLPLAQEDERMNDHIRSVGSDACRYKIRAFQIDALKRRDHLIPLIDSMILADELVFSIPTGAILEYAVLEYPFSFWQYAHNCDEIPSRLSSHKEIFTYLNSIVGYDFYSEKTYEKFKAALYQFYTENGYYSFITEHVKHLLFDLDNPSNKAFAPRGVELQFDKSFMPKIDYRMRQVGSHMIHVHGAYDPWGIIGFVPSQDQDALYFLKPEAGHKTRIRDLDQASKDLIYQKLNEWLEAEVRTLD
jgi:hypothetical protein